MDSTGTTNGRWSTQTEAAWKVARQGLPAPFVVALYDVSRYVGHFTNVHTAQDYAEGIAHEHTRRVRQQAHDARPPG